MFDGSSHQQQSEQGREKEDWKADLGGERAGRVPGKAKTQQLPDYVNEYLNLYKAKQVSPFVWDEKKKETFNWADDFSSHQRHVMDIGMLIWEASNYKESTSC